MSDWLDTQEDQLPVLAIPAELPTDPRERLVLLEECWKGLTPKQRKFLETLRRCGMNAHRAERMGGGSRRSHASWRAENQQYNFVMRVFLEGAASKALNKERLLARQDDIVETLLTPRPILHDGIPVRVDGEMLEVVEAGAASRANEVLLKAAGVLKDKEIEVNVGVALNAPPTLNIQVLPAPVAQQSAEPERVPIDAQFTQVPDDDGWLDT